VPIYNEINVLPLTIIKEIKIFAFFIQVLRLRLQRNPITPATNGDQNAVVVLSGDLKQNEFFIAS